MFVDDLFDKKSLTEAQGGGSPWHSEPEQQQMDANRRGRLGRERNAGLDEPDDAVSGSAQTGNGVYEYTVPAGQESTAQELGLQQHRGHWFSRVPIQRANFQFGRPQFREIPSQGVAEGLPQTLRKVVPGYAKREIDKKMDAGKFGKTDADKDANFQRYKKIQDKIKEQGVAEGSKEKTPGVALSKAYKKDFDGNKPGHTKPETALTGTYSKTGKPGGELKKKGVAEGMLDNPGEQDSPVASAIIRRILLQRTDLLAKYGPEKVGQAVDDVADFVGDVDEIGSSDVSGWVNMVKEILDSMEEGLAEGKQVNEVFNIVPNLEQQIAKKEDELKALKAKLSAKTTTNAGIQTGATALIDPDTKRPYEKDKLAAMYGYKEPVAEPGETPPATAAATPSTSATNPAGFNAGNVMKLPGMQNYTKPATAVAPKTANFGAGPAGYAKTTTSIKPPAAPSSPALAAPSVPKVPRVTAGGPTPAEKANLEKRLAAAAPAVAETLQQIDRMLESVNSKKSAEIIKAYADQRFTELGLRNTTECKQIMAHVVHESAVRRRAYAQRMAK